MKIGLKLSRNFSRSSALWMLGACIALGGMFGTWPRGELKAQGYATVDLGLSASAPSGSVQPGGMVTINYVVSNAGPNAAHGVVFVSPQNKKSKIVSTNGCLEDPIPGKWCTVKLPGGELQAGQSIPIAVTLEVAPLASGIGALVLESMVSANEPDHNPGNEYNSTTLFIK